MLIIAITGYSHNFLSVAKLLWYNSSAVYKALMLSRVYVLVFIIDPLKGYEALLFNSVNQVL